MKRNPRIVACCLVMVLATGAPPLLADQNGVLSLEQAAAMVRRQSGGTILAAESRMVKGKLMYRIKVLTKQQHVRSVWIDPGKQGKSGKKGKKR